LIKKNVILKAVLTVLLRTAFLSFQSAPLSALDAEGSAPVPPEENAEGGDDYAIWEETQGITVTGTKIEKRLKDSPVVTEIITAEEIKHSNADTLSDILGDYGLMYTSNGMGDYIQLQGMDKNRVLYLVNGRRLIGRNSQRIKGETLPLANVERIEIVRGPQSALYGSDSIGGVINVITKKPEDTLTLSSSLTNRFLPAYNDPDTPKNPGPFDSFNPAREQNLNAVLGVPLGITRNSLDIEAARAAYYLDEDRSESILPEYYRGRVGLDTAFPLGTRWDLRLGGAFMFLRRDDQTDTDGSRNRFDYIRADGYLEADFYPRENWSITVRTYDNFYRRDKDIYSAAGDSWNRGENRESENLAALEALGVYAGLPDWIFSAGIEGAYNSTEKYDFTVPVAVIDREALFLQAEYFRQDIFSVLGGLRVERNSRFGFAGAPKLSGMIHLPRGFRFLAGAGLGYRAPSFNDLYLDYESATQHTYGNPDLEPEYSIGANATLEFALSGYFAELTVYYNELFNEIDDFYLGTEGRQRFYEKRNIARSMRTGIDAEGKIRFLTYGYVSPGYSWLYAYDRGAETRLYPQPDHTLKLKLGMDLRKPGINTYVLLRYFSALINPARPDNKDRFILDFYFSVDLGNHFTFFAGVDNITGTIDPLGPATAQVFSLGLRYVL
jgi:outer membrane receptor for ferrienterochelin and colicins